jgi:hypothetical protein
MADPRDYMLAIGAKLIDADITKITSQIKAALKDIPQLEIREVGLAQLQRDMQSGISVTKAYAAAQKESASITTALGKAQTQFASEIEKSSQAEAKAWGQADSANKKASDNISRAWRETTSSVVASMATMKSAIEAMEAQRNDMLSKQAGIVSGNDTARGQSAAFSQLSNGFTEQSHDVQIQQMLDENKKLNEQRSETRATAQSMADGLQVIDQQAERTAATMARYTPALLSGVEAHRRMNLVLPEGIKDVRGFADEFTHMIGQFALWSAGAHLIEGAVGTIGKGMSDAVHSEAEQNITGQYYKAAGGDYTPAMSQQAQQSAIDMAREYGEEVIHVQENIGLWAKVTRGELIPAISLTNDAMKIAAVSGMNMEEIYRDSIAVMGQMQEPLSRVADLYNIATGLALKYGGGIQTLGGQSDDAVKQMMDGMTALSAVMVVGLGKGHDTLARIGAEVAVVSNSMNKSGEEVASHLAAAFSSIEGNSSIIKNLKSIGIEAKNDQELIEKIGANSAKAIPIIMDHGVRPGDKEYMLTLIESYKDYAKAVSEAKQAETTSASDQVFNSMLGTTQQQLKQLRSGWEAVGITVGREFLPFMQKAASIGNNQVIPWLLENKSDVVTLAEELVKLGIAFGTFSIVKTVVATAVRAFNEFEVAVGKTAAAESLSSRAMIMDMTAYQRECLNALATTGEADEEMIFSVKLLAVQYNISMDAVILKLNEVKRAARGTAATVVTDEELMGTASIDVATKIGAAGAAVKSEFAGIVVAGEKMSVTIANAFLKMIPIVGIALTAFEVGKFALDQFSKGNDDYLRSHPSRLAYALSVSEQNEHGYFTDYTNANKRIRSEQNDMSHTGQLHLGRDIVLRDQAEQGVNNEEAYRSQLRNNPNANALTQQQQTMKGVSDRLKELDAEAAAAKAKGYVTPPTGQDNYQTAATPTKGLAGQSGEMGQRIDDIVTKYDAYSEALKAAAKLDDQEIAAAQKRISIYGNTAASVANLTGYLQAKNTVDNESIKNLTNEGSSLQKELVNDKANIRGKDPKLASTVSMQNRIDALERKISSIGDALASAEADLQKNRETAGDVKDTQGQQAFDSEYNSIKTGYSTAKSAASGAKTVASATAAYSALTAARKNADEAITTEITLLDQNKNKFGEVTTQSQEWITKLQDLQATIDGDVNPAIEQYAALQIKLKDAMSTNSLEQSTKDPALLTALKALAAAQKDYNDNLKISADAGKDNSLALAYEHQQVAIASATFALAEYNEEKTKAEASSLYQDLSAGIDDLGNALLKTLETPLNYFKSQMQEVITDSDSRIRQLQAESAALRGPQYQGIRQTDMLEERTQQQQASAAQYKLDNPTMLQSLSSTLQKSFSTSIVSSIESSTKGGLLQTILGQSDPTKTSQNQFQTSVNIFALAVKGMPGAGSSASSAGNGTLFAAGDADGVGGNTATQANTSATTAASAATTAATAATLSGTTVSKTLNTTMTSLSKALSSALSGASEGSGIASLLGGNAAGGATAGGIAGLLTSLISVGGKSLSSTPLGAGVTAAAGLIGGLFGGPQMNATNNPDVVNPTSWAQFITNMQGGTYNGTSEDPSISAQTGGLSEGAYIENFLQGKSQAQLTSVFGSESTSIQQMFGQFQQDGGLTNLSNGNLDVSGESVNWQTIQTEATDAFTAITTAANSLNQALAPIISISAYGKGSNSSTFSPYYTPGYGDTSALSSIPYPSLFATNPTTATYSAAPSATTQTVQTTVNLDGQQIAQNTSQYRSQQLQRGFMADTP